MSDEEQKSWAGEERRSVHTQESMWSLISERMKVMHGDITDVRTAVNALTTAVTRLAVVEERLVQQTVATERLFKAIEGLDKRVATLEVQNPINKRMTHWAEMLFVGAVIVLIYYILNHVGVPTP